MSNIKTGNIKTYYELTGKGETVVFIHGLGSSAEDWSYQTEFFSKHFQVLAYDVRGHGQSDKPKGAYSVPLFAEDLLNLLNALAIEKVHIVGLSMGGWIVFQFGLDYPERVKSLTVVNSWADMRLKKISDKINFYKRTVLFQLLTMRKIGEIIGKKLFIKPEQKELLQNFIEKWAKNHKPSYLASFKAVKGWSVEDRLSEITCPVLVVSADEDYTPVSDKEAYAAKMINAEFVELAVVKDSRHATPVEHPAEFNQVVGKFLSKVK
ncbi:MAG: alpha/beta hydrolase [SAR324 cluster bacterium]|nr:alpha/beta hydrolase [SAR324 cluster bacterium]